MRIKKDVINKKYKTLDENGNEWGIELITLENCDRSKYKSFFILNGKKFEYSSHTTMRDAENFWMLVEALLKNTGKNTHE